MKVLLINNFFSLVGGVEVYISKLGGMLRKYGIEVGYFATDKQPYLVKGYKYSKYFPHYKDFNAIKLKEFIKNPSYFYNVEAKEKLDEFLEIYKPDIAHINSISRHLSPSVIKSLKEKGIPVIMTLHDGFFACPDTGLIKGNGDFCYKYPCAKGNVFHCILNKCNEGSLIKSIVSSSEFFYRKIHRLYDKIDLFIAPSRAIKDLALYSGVNKQKIVLLNNFIDEDLFTYEPDYLSKNYFLYAGRLVKEKGIEFLLQAMLMLPPEIELHIAGSGEQEEELKNLALLYGLNNVKFLGMLSQSELKKEYRDCIASVLPANYFEAFGLSVIESFAYGKPVIGTDIGAIPELIDNGKTGYLVKSANPEELAGAMLKLINNNIAVKMGRIARLEALSKYSAGDHADKLIKIYKQFSQ